MLTFLDVFQTMLLELADLQIKHTTHNALQ